MANTYAIDSSKYSQLKKSYVIEGSKYAKLGKTYVIENGKYVKLWNGGGASGFIVGSYGTIQHSEAGTSWTTKNIGSSTYGYVCGSAYGNGMYVVMTSERYVGYSTDGTTWTFKIIDSSIPGSDLHYINVQFCDGTFIITFRDATNYDSWLYSSTDGINWTLVKKNFGAAKEAPKASATAEQPKQATPVEKPKADTTAEESKTAASAEEAKAASQEVPKKKKRIVLH